MILSDCNMPSEAGTSASKIITVKMDVSFSQEVVKSFVPVYLTVS